MWLYTLIPVVGGLARRLVETCRRNKCVVTGNISLSAVLHTVDRLSQRKAVV